MRPTEPGAPPTAPPPLCQLLDAEAPPPAPAAAGALAGRIARHAWQGEAGVGLAMGHSGCRSMPKSCMPTTTPSPFTRWPRPLLPRCRERRQPARQWRALIDCCLHRILLGAAAGRPLPRTAALDSSKRPLAGPISRQAAASPLPPLPGHRLDRRGHEYEQAAGCRPTRL
jgi:hypothetical protein